MHPGQLTLPCSAVQPETTDLASDGFGVPWGVTRSWTNGDGSGAQTTSYAYTFFPNTVQVQSVAVTLPVISAAQNGPGSADVETTYFDASGRPIWHKDGDGFLTYTAYDPATGAFGFGVAFRAASGGAPGTVKVNGALVALTPPFTNHNFHYLGLPG
jgi:hypothetical protein